MERLHHADTHHNHHQQQLKLKLKPTTTSATKLKHNQTIPQPQDAAALNSRSNQQEARATRRVAATEQAHAQCAAEDPANPNLIATSRQKPAAAAAVVVLRRCEDLRIRTSGFQKIEEDSQRRPIDLRRQHKLQRQQQQRA